MGLRYLTRCLRIPWGAFAIAFLAGSMMTCAASATNPVPVGATERAAVIEELATTLSTSYIDARMAGRIVAQLRRNASCVRSPGLVIAGGARPLAARLERAGWAIGQSSAGLVRLSCLFPHARRRQRLIGRGIDLMV